jgi:hypothetical protein
LISRPRTLCSVITLLTVAIIPTEISLRTTTLRKRAKATLLAIKTIALRMNETGSLNKNRGNIRRSIARDLSLSDSARDVRHITAG